MPVLDVKITHLHSLLREMQQMVVCFSGGVDSGYLLAEAVAVVGEGAVALTAVSPSLAPEEGADARRLAEQLGARHVLIETHELDDPRYAANPLNRCYFCKVETYEVARGVRSPLDELGFTKDDVRVAARRIGLPVWNKPALACLSSRFPYGTEITAERLTQVWRCERALHAQGFKVCRVRYDDVVARIEVAPEEIPRLFETDLRQVVVREFRAAGFQHVTVDLQGYRTGSLNETAAGPAEVVSLTAAGC